MKTNTNKNRINNKIKSKLLFEKWNWNNCPSPTGMIFKMMKITCQKHIEYCIGSADSTMKKKKKEIKTTLLILWEEKISILV